MNDDYDDGEDSNNEHKKIDAKKPINKNNQMDDACKKFHAEKETLS